MKKRFTVKVSPKAERDLKKLSADVRLRVLEALKFLEESPWPRGEKIKKLYGHQLYRLRAGDWRVVYSIEGEEVIVHLVAHRSEVYKLLHKRAL